MEDWFSTYEDGNHLRHPYKEPVGSRLQASSAGVWAAVAHIALADSKIDLVYSPRWWRRGRPTPSPGHSCTPTAEEQGQEAAL